MSNEDDIVKAKKKKVPIKPNVFSWIETCPNCNRILDPMNFHERCICGQVLKERNE